MARVSVEASEEEVSIDGVPLEGDILRYLVELGMFYEKVKLRCRKEEARRHRRFWRNPWAMFFQ